MSSAVPTSSSMAKGGVRASERTRISRASTSISPVGIFGFTVSGARAATSPTTAITNSPRTPSALGWGAEGNSDSHHLHSPRVADVDEDHADQVAPR